jgi:hypothetical protein
LLKFSGTNDAEVTEWHDVLGHHDCRLCAVKASAEPALKFAPMKVSIEGQRRTYFTAADVFDQNGNRILAGAHAELIVLKWAVTNGPGFGIST